MTPTARYEAAVQEAFRQKGLPLHEARQYINATQPDLWRQVIVSGLTRQQIALANIEARSASKNKSTKAATDQFVEAVHAHMREHPAKSYVDAWRYCTLVSHEALHNQMTADPQLDFGPKAKTYLRLPPNADETEVAVAWLSNGKQVDAVEIVNMLQGLIALRQARSGEDKADAREWAKGRYPELWARLPKPPHALDGSPKQ